MGTFSAGRGPSRAKAQGQEGVCVQGGARRAVRLQEGGAGMRPTVRPDRVASGWEEGFDFVPDVAFVRWFD